MALHALKKITIRDVIKGEPEKEEREIMVPDGKGGATAQKAMVAKAADLCVIYGRAHDHRSGTTQLGDYIEYIGRFEARRADGETFQSTRFIPPPITNDLMEQAFFNAKKEDESAQVDFAFVIGVEPDLTPNSAKGYKYTCKPVMTGAVENDPLQELRASLSAQFVEALGEATASKLGLAGPPSTPALEDKSSPAGSPATDDKAKGKNKETAPA